jgi:hypothetical protein
VKYIPAPLRILGAIAVSVGLYACLGNSPPGAPLDEESPVGSVQQATTCSTSWHMATAPADPCESITTSGACTNHYVNAQCADPPCSDWYLCSWSSNQCVSPLSVHTIMHDFSCIPTCEGAASSGVDCSSITTQGGCDGHYHNDGTHNWRCDWNPGAGGFCATEGWCNTP